MTPIEQQALALINEIYREKGDVAQGWFQRTLENKYGEALCRAIERHEAFKREVSDAVEAAERVYGGHRAAFDKLTRFIIPEPVDPLVEAFDEAMREGPQTSTMVDQLRKALAARGLEIVEKKP